MSVRVCQGLPFLIEYADNAFNGSHTTLMSAASDPADPSGVRPIMSLGATGVAMDLKGTVTINGAAVATVGNADADLLGSYFVKTATNAPPNAQVLASLATGLLKVTTTTGALTTATADTDYAAPGTLKEGGATVLTVAALTDGALLSRSGSTVASATAQAAAGTTSGFTLVGASAIVAPESTFTGGSGASAYTIGDIVKALKALKLLAD